jgi:hypothetical protein
MEGAFVSDRTAELEAKVEALSAEMGRLGDRLAALEAGRTAVAVHGARRLRRADGSEVDGAGRAAADPALGLVGASLSFGGRTLLVLAGAFVLRALTDAGTIPGWLGVALGFAYAAAWIGAAERAARAGGALSAGVHGFAALLIAFPLLFEATARFKLLEPTAAVVALALVTTALLGLAARRRLQALAWLASAGSILTAVALMVHSARVVPGTLFIILLGIECLWLSYVRDWHAIRWPAAVVADLAVFTLAVRAVAPGAAEGPGPAMLVQAVLLAAYLGSFATRTLLLNRGVVPFEVFQTVSAVAAGLGGAAFVAARTTGVSAGPFGVAATVFGLAAYGVAFAFRGRREQDQTNFPFYTSVAVLLVSAGTGLLLDGPALALVWSLLAVLSAELVGRLGRRTLGVHATGYAFGAALAGSLLAVASDALLTTPDRAWTAPGSATLVAWIAACACAWFGSRGAPEARPSLVSRLPQLLVVILAAAGAAGLLVWGLVPLMAGVPGAASIRGEVASVRTLVLVGGTIFLAWAGRRPAWREAGWLVYPLLVATGVKVLFEDLTSGRPATLFVSFGLYGAALLIVPRLRPRGGVKPLVAPRTHPGPPASSVT